MSGTEFFEDLLGETLLEGKGRQVTTKSVVEGKEYVAIYHSASWCRTSRFLTPQIAKAYKEIQKKDTESLATVFVSDDRSENDFDEYFGEMPWHAKPFSPKPFRGFGKKLASEVSIPTLAVYDKRGKLVKKDALVTVTELGADFLRAIIPEEKKKLVADSMEKLFHAFDLNGDGFVDKDEILKCFELLQAPAPFATKELQKLMARDADMDGKLSKNEFCVSEYSVGGRSAGFISNALAKSVAEHKAKVKAEADIKLKLDNLKGQGVEFFKALLGDKVLSKSSDEVDIKYIVEGKQYVGICQSAQWCPQSSIQALEKTFALIESEDSQKLSVVFVSLDVSDDAFKEYYRDMPWHAVPFSNKEFVGISSPAATYLKCKGEFPKFAVFDGNGNLVNAQCMGLVSQHGQDFLSKI